VIVHSQEATGRRLETGTTSGVAWDGRNEFGDLVPSGTYSWTLRAQDAQGRLARPATGSVIVITDHLSGSVLRDPAGIYVRDAGSARQVSNLTLLTLYSRRGAIPTGSAERGRYSPAPLSAMAPRQGALLRDPDGELLIVSSATGSGATEVRGFMPPEVAASLGYTPNRAIAVSDTDLVGTTRGAAISTADRHPAGTFVRVTVAGVPSFYRMRAADRIPATPFTITANGALFQIVNATAGDLALPVAAGTKVEAPEGSIGRVGTNTWLLTKDDLGVVERRPIRDEDLFDAYGPWSAGVIPATYDDVKQYRIGAPIR
jgi:hypothetical protein